MAGLFDWSVLAFFFSSGFLHDRLVPFNLTVKKRFVTLLVPFGLYNVLYNSCFAATDALGLVHQSHFRMNSELAATDLFRSPAFQLYFLPYLFAITIGVRALEKLIPRRPGLLYFVLLLLVLAFYLVQGYPEISYGPAFINLPIYLTAFLIGVIIRPFSETFFASRWMILGALAVVLGVLVLSRFRAVSLLVPPLVAAAAGAIRTIRQSKLLLCMGGMSGSIYVWHTPVVLPAITRFLSHYGIPSLLNFFGSICLALVACILLRLGLDALFVQVTKSQTPKYITL
jgi:peptidoglycan/LPS O-acetylase OafA/YrhL